MPRKADFASSSDISRRSFLSAAGATVGTLAVSGTAAGYHDDYDVVNVVEAGADDTGEEPITDVLRDNLSDRVAFEFPPGEYLMDEQLRFTDFDKFALFGNDATIKPAQADEFEGPARLFKLGTYANPGGWVRVENIDFDFTRPNTGLRALQIQADDLFVDNVHCYGQHDTGTWGPYLFDVLDDSRIGMVRNTTANGGGAYASNTPQDHTPAVAGDDGPTGIIVSPYHEGKLWFRDCELGGFPGNGLYSSGDEGTVVVDGGEYRNSNVANIRLDGTHCYVKGVDVIVDETREKDINQRGIRFDEGDDFWVYDTTIRMPSCNGEAIRLTNGVESADVQEVSIYLDDGEGVEDAISVSGGAGDVRIFDSEIEMESGGQAIELQGYTGDWAPTLVEDVTITGDASGGYGGSNAIRCERSGSRFYNLDVDQPGADYRRCLVIDANECRVAYGTYQSTHHPIVNNGDGTVISSIEARAYNGYEAIKTLEDHEDVGIYDSTLYNGIRTRGNSEPATSGNEFPSA